MNYRLAVSTPSVALAAVLLLLLPLPALAAASRLRKDGTRGGMRLRTGFHSSGKSGVNLTSRRLKNDHPYYHTSGEIKTELKRLSENCRGADFTVLSVADGNVSIDLVRVRGHSAKPMNRVFLLSGEHARELISPESTLHFLRKLCDEGTATVDGTNVLLNSEFAVVVNGNPRSRERVEEGDYCLRANPDGVDLNRNWDEQFKGTMTISTDTGPYPFSEPETRIVKGMVEKFKPTAFLSVHSGTLGMYMPWAWSSEKIASRNKKSQLYILEALDAKRCKCPFGGAGKEVGYPCPGTSVDWVFDKLQTPYSFAFEIWGNPRSMPDLQQRWKNKLESGGTALLQAGAHLAHPHFEGVFEPHRSDFIQLAATEEASGVFTMEEELRNAACFEDFNPATEKLYAASVENWAMAYLEMSAMIAEELRTEKAVI